jgi:hypothetical protein
LVEFWPTIEKDGVLSAFEILHILEECRLSKLLNCVTKGQQMQAEEIIKKDFSLLLLSGRATDYSG